MVLILVFGVFWFPRGFHFVFIKSGSFSKEVAVKSTGHLADVCCHSKYWVSQRTAMLGSRSRRAGFIDFFDSQVD